MVEPIVETSTITEKGQTTVPKAVRQALGVKQGDTIAFRVADGHVSVERVVDEHEDAALAPFLTFLAKDLETRRSAIKSLGESTFAEIRELTKGMPPFDPEE